MKKLTITLSDEAHLELLKLQLERKTQKHPRTTLVEVASDFLDEQLKKLKEGK